MMRTRITTFLYYHSMAKVELTSAIVYRGALNGGTFVVKGSKLTISTFVILKQ